MLAPLRFEPIFKSMIWGGRRLPGFLNRPHPTNDPIGEAWVLSDVDGHSSRVLDGPLAGRTLRELLARDAAPILGRARTANGRFPLLLKFIDAQQELSVQVHPNDEQAAARIPGASGKTEAWVILDADPRTSRIYAGFREGITAPHFHAAMQAKTTPHTLHSFAPNPGDCVFLEAGTVHAIGADILLFEVQQTSDITYRLYDWDRVDAKTGRGRDLHIADGLACADFAKGPCRPVAPRVAARGRNRHEGLVECPHFTLSRHIGAEPFAIGRPGECTVAVCVGGRGVLESPGRHDALQPGDVWLIPAAAGACRGIPAGELVLLECGVPSEPGA